MACFWFGELVGRAGVVVCREGGGEGLRREDGVSFNWHGMWGGA